jgi:hypothetical protein
LSQSQYTIINNAALYWILCLVYDCVNLVGDYKLA